MITLRRFAYFALAVALAHVVFGGIVRISGSGMGCGDHWPKCFGSWLPPFDQPTVVIEWTHRLLAAILITAVVVLALLSWSRRNEPGVGGRGGVLRGAGTAVGVVVVTALFGMVTVRLGTAPLATVGHWLLAATLLATLTATAIRAGGFGGLDALVHPSSARTERGTLAAAALALIVVMLGGLTAKISGANVACQGFPLCSGSLVPHGGAQHLQWTHRLLAYLLFFHVLGLTIGVGRRRESPPVLHALRVALALLFLQIAMAAAMVELHLPLALRSLHQATGAGIWLTLFAAAYLAGRRERGKRKEERGEGRGVRDEGMTCVGLSARASHEHNPTHDLPPFRFPLSAFQLLPLSSFLLPPSSFRASP